MLYLQVQENGASTAMEVFSPRDGLLASAFALDRSGIMADTESLPTAVRCFDDDLETASRIYARQSRNRHDNLIERCWRERPGRTSCRLLSARK